MKKLKHVGLGLKSAQSGITLIALVITIIVLLILAGVTINLTLGQNGILKTAESAGKEHQYAQLKEELELEIFNIQTRKIAEGKKFVREDLRELSGIGATINSVGIPAEGEYKDYYFEVDEEYKVTIIGKLQGEKPSIQAEILTTGIVAQGGTVEIKVTAGIAEGSIQTIEATNGAVLKTETSATEKVYGVSANGTYYFKTTADNGRSTVVAVIVNTIIEKPVIEIKDIGKTGFTIAVTNNYAEGLITEYKYYVAGSVKSEGTTETEYAVTGLTEETEYTNIYVEAYLGEQKLTSEEKTVTTKPLGLEYSWEELNKIAKAISDNDETITNETAEAKVTIDGKEYTVAVGDTTKVEVNGTLKTVRIIGFNHDTLANTSAYGRTNTYAGISFEFIDFVIASASMNGSDTNSGGWAAMRLRNILNNTTINSLSNSTYIKEVNKSCIQKYNDASSVGISVDKLWLLSCSEIWNNGYSSGTYGEAITKEGEQYKYYKDINAKYNTANTGLLKSDYDYWWLRSPTKSGSFGFCVVVCGLSGGYCANNYCGATYGVAPGFSI